MLAITVSKDGSLQHISQMKRLPADGLHYVDHRRRPTLILASGPHRRIGCLVRSKYHWPITRRRLGRSRAYADDAELDRTASPYTT